MPRQQGAKRRETSTSAERNKVLSGALSNHKHGLFHPRYFKVTRASYFVRVPSYFEILWYPHLYFDLKSNI